MSRGGRRRRRRKKMVRCYLVVTVPRRGDGSVESVAHLTSHQEPSGDPACPPHPTLDSSLPPSLPPAPTSDNKSPVFIPRSMGKAGKLQVNLYFIVLLLLLCSPSAVAAKQTRVHLSPLKSRLALDEREAMDRGREEATEGHRIPFPPGRTGVLRASSCRTH